MLRQQDQLMRHNELMKQRENDLQKLEDDIRKKKDSWNQQIQQHQQEQQQQPQQQLPKRKKAKKERKVTGGVELASPVLQSTSWTTSQEKEPTSDGQPHLEALGGSKLTDNTAQKLDKSTRLKPIINRKLRRQEHWRNRLSMSMFSPASSQKSTNFITPTSHGNQQCLQTSSSSVSSSVIGSESKCAEGQTPSIMAANNFINKASVMEFYLKEKLRESGLREFEMFLKSN